MPHGGYLHDIAKRALGGARAHVCMQALEMVANNANAKVEPQLGSLPPTVDASELPDHLYECMRELSNRLRLLRRIFYSPEELKQLSHELNGLLCNHLNT